VLTLHAFVGVDEHVGSLPLFRLFLRHYRDIGVERFVLDLHSERADAARLDAFRAEAEAGGATIRHIVFGPYTAHRNHKESVHSFMAEYGQDDAWCLLADADEFVKFPTNAVEFLHERTREGCNLVIGNLLDRLSLDPPFPPIDDARTVDELFPWSYPLTRQIRRGVDRKVVAFRGRFSCAEGRHRLVDEPEGLPERERAFKRCVDYIESERIRARLHRLYHRWEPTRDGIHRWRGRLEVHHVAWDDRVRTRMELRACMPGLTHADEIANVLRFVQLPDPATVLHAHLLQRAALRDR
jgi:hypothetical protein